MGSKNKLEKIFGPIVDGKWVNESEHITYIDVPRKMVRTFDTTSILCNKVIAVGLKRALGTINRENLHRSIHSYDGCFIPGSSSDLHRYAIAIALNADAPYFEDRILQIFRLTGFVNEGYRFIWAGNE